MRKFFLACGFGCVAVLGSTTLAVGQSTADDDPSAMVYVRDSPAVKEEIARARRFAAEERYEAAAELLHTLVRDRGDTLVAIEPDLYTSVAEGVRRLLAEVPELGDSYRVAFGAKAERRLSQAVEGGVDVPAMRSVAESFWYTPAGLEANLLLAGMELERADGDAAVDRLEELATHPDAAGVSDRRTSLLAAARLLSGRSATLDAALGEASLSGERKREVERFAQSLTRDREALLQRGDLPALGAPERLLAESLWEVRLDAVVEMGAEAAVRRRLREQLWSRSAGGQSPVPVVSADRIVVKAADNFYAVDRNSGRLLWRRETGLDPLRNLPNDPRVRRQLLQVFAMRMRGDEGGMAVAADDLAAIVGASSGGRGRRRGGGHGIESAVLKLDASTGRIQWRRTPADLDDSLADGGFTGDPVILGDTVYAFVVRRQNAGLQDLLLTAVSLAEGRLRWSEHVSSLTTSRRGRRGRGGTAPPQMKPFGNRVYASDGIATVACFDATTGRVRWSRIVPVSQRQVEQGLARAGSSEVSSRLAAPLRVRAGLLINLAPRPDATMLIDPDTGRLVRELRGAEWGGERLLLPWKGDVISIHPPYARRIDGESLEVLWSVDIPASQLQGAPALGDRYAALPTERGVVTIDLEEGRIARRLGTGNPGHAILLDGQIVLSDHAGLVSYLSWEQTSQRLRRAIANEPANPAPALDLVRIALAIDRRETLGEALDFATAAAAHTRDHGSAPDHAAGTMPAADARRMVFEELRELAQQADPERAEAVTMLLTKLGMLADTPRERATYHLMQGRHHAASGRATQAVEHLQEVLAHEPLADTLFETPRASRRAAVEARRQLARLLEQGAPELYAAFRAEARSELASLTEGSARAPDRLEALARRYPFAPAAAEAMLEAARTYRVMDRTRQALAALRQADELAQRTDAPRGAILGQWVDLYLATGQPRAAARELRRIARNHPRLVLITDSTRRTASHWLAEVAPLAHDAGTLPRWGPPLSETRRFAGAPMPSLVPQPRLGPVLFTDASGRLVAYSHDRMEPLWSVAANDENTDAPPLPVIVAHDDRRVVLWRSGKEQLVARSVSDGTEAWRRSAREVFGVQGETRKAAASQPRVVRQAVVRANIEGGIQIAQRRGGASESEPSDPAGEALKAARAMFHADGQRLAWALPSGRFAVLRLDDGQSQWRTRFRQGVLEGIRIGEAGVAVWGGIAEEAGTMSGVTLAFDVETGDALTGVIETEAPAVHADASEGGLMLAMPEQVRRYDVATGELVWRSDVAGAAIAGGGWTDQGVVVYVDEVSNALALDTRSGEMLWREPVGLNENDPVRAGRLTPGEITLLAGSGLARFDLNRGEAWRDAVTLPRKRLYAFDLSHRHAIVAADEGGRVPIFGNPDNFETPPAIRLFLLDRDTGRLSHHFHVAPAPTPMNPRLTRLTDHWLVLSDGGESLLLRGEPEPMPRPAPASTPPSPPAPPSPLSPSEAPSSAGPSDANATDDSPADGTDADSAEKDITEKGSSDADSAEVHDAEATAGGEPAIRPDAAD